MNNLEVTVTQRQKPPICPFLDMECLGPMGLCPLWMADVPDEITDLETGKHHAILVEDCLFHVIIVGVKEQLKAAAAFVDQMIGREPGTAQKYIREWRQILNGQDREVVRFYVRGMIKSHVDAALRNVTMQDVVQFIGKLDANLVGELFGDEGEVTVKSEPGGSPFAGVEALIKSAYGAFIECLQDSESGEEEGPGADHFGDLPHEEDEDPGSNDC